MVKLIGEAFLKSWHVSRYSCLLSRIGSRLGSVAEVCVLRNNLIICCYSWPPLTSGVQFHLDSSLTIRVPKVPKGKPTSFFKV